MGYQGLLPSQAAAAHAMAWLEMGNFGAVRRQKDGRIYVELPNVAGGERRIWVDGEGGGNRTRRKGGQEGKEIKDFQAAIGARTGRGKGQRR